jgi:hypothetical protein
MLALRGLLHTIGVPLYGRQKPADRAFCSIIALSRDMPVGWTNLVPFADDAGQLYAYCFEVLQSMTALGDVVLASHNKAQVENHVWIVTTNLMDQGRSYVVANGLSLQSIGANKPVVSRLCCLKEFFDWQDTPPSLNFRNAKSRCPKAWVAPMLRKDMST